MIKKQYNMDFLQEAGYTVVEKGQGEPSPAPPIPSATDLNTPAAAETPAPPSNPVVDNNIEQTPQSAAEPTPQAVPTAFNEEEYLNGRFKGRFKSLEEIEKAYVAMEEQSNKNPFHSDLIKGANDFVSKGGDLATYAQLQTLDFDKMTPKEILVMTKVMRDGLTKEDAEFKVQRQYKLSEELKDDEGNDRLDVREAQIDFKADTKTALEYLKQYKVENLMSNYDKEMAVVKKEWDAELPSLSNSLKSINITAKSGEYSFPVSAETIAKATEAVKEAIDNGFIEASPQSAEAKTLAKEIANNYIIKQELSNIIDYIHDGLKKKQLEEKHNIRQPQPQQTVPATDPYDILESSLAKQYGVKLN